MADTAFYGPRSRENARLLINTAKELGIPTSQVRTQTGGYVVPVAIVDMIAGREIEEVDVEASMVGEDGPEVASPEMKRPSAADSKADWLEYAQEGLGLAVTDENTKAEIIEAVKAEEETD